MDPNLLPPGVSPEQAHKVAPLQAMTKPMSNVKGEMKYYYSTMQTTSMHRPDGKRIPFLFNICMTDIIADQKYIEEEIANGNTYIREATEDEIRAAQIRMDPKGTYKKEARAELEAELSKELEAKIEARLRAEAAANGGILPTAPVLPAEVPVDDATKLGGTTIAQQMLENLKKAQQSGSGKLTPVSTAQLAGAADSNSAK